MPGPSDIRVNPFNDATNYINLTERHIVPSVSPFVVRLNEVPEKQDPSNMQMYYVDDTTGQTTETALTEVAATPGAGEFRPDYSTNAFDDTSWNTGLIEFSSADAGKIIEVSYTATGTLAGVKTNRYPAWWLDRGDGSDGAFNPTRNTTISGEKNYTSVFIPAGVTVTVKPSVRILCQGSFVNHGTINGNGNGGSGGVGGITRQRDAGDGGNGIIGDGGKGGNNSAGNNLGGVGGIGTFRNYNNEITFEITKGSAFGSGGGGGGAGIDQNVVYKGGNGGAGGAGIAIIAAEVINRGTISANGSAGGGGGWRSGGGGGGSGGCIAVIAQTISNSGSISANGGSGGANTGGGGGGRGGAGSAGITKIIELGVL